LDVFPLVLIILQHDVHFAEFIVNSVKNFFALIFAFCRGWQRL